MSNHQQQFQSCKIHLNGATVQNVQFCPEVSSPFPSITIFPKTAENRTLIFKSLAALLVLWKDKPVQHAFYLSFKFVPDARICDCLGEDPKLTEICRWNELPAWLVCLYCKRLAFSPHLLASTYSDNKVFVLLLLVEIQLREKVLPPLPHR